MGEAGAEERHCPPGFVGSVALREAWLCGRSVGFINRKNQKPVRVVLSRKAGFNLQNESFKLNGLPCVVVARPTKWGNPVKVGDWFDGRQITRADAVKWYEQHITTDSLMGQDAVRELRGKNLACWCKITDESGNYVPCHADILLALANGMSHDEVRNENLKDHKRRTE